MDSTRKARKTAGNCACFLPPLSPNHRGATAPQIAEVEMTMEYVGEEEKTVAAGHLPAAAATAMSMTARRAWAANTIPISTCG